MKRRKKYRKIYKLLFVVSIMFIVLMIYLYNDNILIIKDVSSSIFNLKKDNFKSKENIEISELKKEIQNLKELNNIKELNIDSEYIDARVIKRNNSYWNESLTINVGKKDNVKRGDAVTYNNSLIGIISLVNKNTSTVKLITSNNKNYISAKFTIDNNEYFGIIKKYNLLKNELYLENVIGDFSINNEDVVTSGLEGNIPEGIYIGKIMGIEKDKYNLANKIIVKPEINFNNIKYVKVILK